MTRRTGNNYSGARWTHSTRRRKPKRTFKDGEVQQAAFGIAGPEQGELNIGGAPYELDAHPRICSTCGVELQAYEHNADQCSRCSIIGVEPGTLL